MGPTTQNLADFRPKIENFWRVSRGPKSLGDSQKRPKNLPDGTFLGSAAPNSPQLPLHKKPNFHQKPGQNLESFTISSKSALKIYLKSLRKNFSVGPTTRNLADFGPKIENFWRQFPGIKTVENRQKCPKNLSDPTFLGSAAQNLSLIHI